MVKRAGVELVVDAHPLARAEFNRDRPRLSALATCDAPLGAFR